jgi:hypothetical protein
LRRHDPLPARAKLPHNALGAFDHVPCLEAGAAGVPGLVLCLLATSSLLAAELRLRRLLVGAPIGRGQLEAAASCLLNDELVLPADEIA